MRWNGVTAPGPQNGAPNEGDQRNELFAGMAEPEPERPNEELTVDELIDKADNTHQDTTAAARRALKVEDKPH
jgi:hypothetical protein